MPVAPVVRIERHRQLNQREDHKEQNREGKRDGKRLQLNPTLELVSFAQRVNEIPG